MTIGDPRDELIAALKRELERQWDFNHAEHCTNMAHKSGERCSWPVPRILGVEPGQPVPPDEDPAPHMR